MCIVCINMCLFQFGPSFSSELCYFAPTSSGLHLPSLLFWSQFYSNALASFVFVLHFSGPAFSVKFELSECFLAAIVVAESETVVYQIVFNWMVDWLNGWMFLCQQNLSESTN